MEELLVRLSLNTLDNGRCTEDFNAMDWVVTLVDWVLRLEYMFQMGVQED